MNMGFWNVRGLNSLTKIQEIKWFIHDNKEGLFSLLETTVKSSNGLRIYNGIGNQ